MDLVISVKDFPKVGETIHGKEYVTIPGGKGANQAVAASKLEAKVQMVGCVGKDAYGQELKQTLEKSNIKANQIHEVDGMSGTAFVIVSEQAANEIIVIPAANSKVTKKMVNECLKDIKKGDLALTQLEIPNDVVIHFMKSAQKKGATTVLNPSPYAGFKPEMLDYCNILVLNETEAESITKTKTKNLKDQLSFAHKKGVETVIVTLGEKGSLLSHNGKVTTVPPYKVKAVDTTAAGDSFIGGVLSALCRGETIETAVKYGNAAGALAATKLGAQSSIPSLKEVEKLIK